MSDHPVKPTKQAYEKARSLWGDARGVTEGIQKVTDYGFQEGADYELEACCALMERLGLCSWAQFLRLSRRPKPPSTKEKAFKQLKELEQHGALDCNIDHIREALEELDD